MLRQLKAITTKIAAGANVATAAAMLLAGMADRVNPAEHPYLATAGLLFPVMLAANAAFLVFWLLFKWRMAAIPVAAYAAAIGPIRTYMPINPPADPPEGALKVVSYNVKNFAGPAGGDTQAAQAIATYLAGSGADIVCLQEAVHSRSRATDALYGAYPHTDTTYIGDSNRKSNALAIYTRFPILRKERIPYDSQNNGSVAYFLKVGRDTILVVNNHFESSHLAPDERQRYKEMLKGEVDGDTARAESRKMLRKLAEATRKRSHQANAVSRYLQAHAGMPTILCGDFNDTPISYTHRTLARLLTDCYTATGNGVGLSYNQKGFYVRIDNIMCSAHFEPFGCKVDSKIAASDHYPIYCWLKMK